LDFGIDYLNEIEVVIACKTLFGQSVVTPTALKTKNLNNDSAVVEVIFVSVLVLMIVAQVPLFFTDWLNQSKEFSI
jgi:hypothetical protein